MYNVEPDKEGIVLKLTFSLASTHKALCSDEGKVGVLIKPGLKSFGVFTGFSEQNSLCCLLASVLHACLVFFT